MSTILVRVVGVGQERIVCEGDGRDRPDAHWSVGKCSTITLGRGGDIHVHHVRWLNWFQPDEDPDLTIYIADAVTPSTPNESEQ